jgi:hypothetical protein
VLGGDRVSVFLFAEGSGWALNVDARPWLGGDPGQDIAGLIEDAGAEVLVDADSLGALALSGAVRPRPGVRVAGVDDFHHRYASADMVIAP